MFARVTLLLALFVWATPARGDERRGAVVLARTADATAAARALARVAYRHPALRPSIDEKTARIILGDAPDSVYGKTPVPEKKAELSRVRQAALETTDPAVSTRLLAALGRDLGVALVIVIESAERGPAAKVLDVGEARFLPLSLSPKAELDWSESVPILKGLATEHEHAHASQPKASGPAPTQPPAKDKGKPQVNLLKSPWFWGGLGAVVAVGVTVLVLSQTVLNQPDKVTLDGHISP